MEFKFKIFSLTFIFVLSSFLSLYGQSDKANADSTFSTHMENIMEKLHQSSLSDSLQKKYANEFYQYYLQNESSSLGKKALPAAFEIWGNMGAVKKINKVMAQLKQGSEIWSQFVPFIQFAYANNEQKNYNDYITLLKKLSRTLTNPKSKSQALWMLSLYYHDQHKTEKLTKTARELINLDADDFYVDKGMGYLREIESLNIGQDAPTFYAETIKGKSVSLSDFKNKIIVLDFWATWCGPCIRQLPYIKAIHSKYPNDELQIIGISLDKNLNKLKNFIGKQNMHWPQIQQPRTYNGEIANLYNVNGIPRTYIIGHDGKIIAKDLRGKQLEKEIFNLMK